MQLSLVLIENHVVSLNIPFNVKNLTPPEVDILNITLKVQ